MVVGTKGEVEGCYSRCHVLPAIGTHAQELDSMSTFLLNFADVKTSA